MAKFEEITAENRDYVKTKILWILENMKKPTEDNSVRWSQVINEWLVVNQITPNRLIDIKLSVNAAPGVAGLACVVVIIYK